MQVLSRWSNKASVVASIFKCRLGLPTAGQVVLVYLHRRRSRGVIARDRHVIVSHVCDSHEKQGKVSSQGDGDVNSYIQ